MNDDYEYQLLICDDEFYSGFLVSGYRKIIVSEPGCYKRCGHWCGDFTSPYFRTAGNGSDGNGVAFNTNGHRSLANRLISVGLRWDVSEDNNDTTHPQNRLLMKNAPNGWGGGKWTRLKLVSQKTASLRYSISASIWTVVHRFSLRCLLKWLLVYNECFALIYNRRHSRDLRIFTTDLVTF